MPDNGIFVMDKYLTRSVGSQMINNDGEVYEELSIRISRRFFAFKKTSPAQLVEGAQLLVGKIIEDDSTVVYRNFKPQYLLAITITHVRELSDGDVLVTGKKIPELKLKFE